MRRRGFLAAVAGAGVAFPGCLNDCDGVALALELNTPGGAPDAEALDLDEADLSEREREILDRATRERVTGCTRDDTDALERLVERMAAHAGVDASDLYYSEGRLRRAVRYEGDRYRAVVVYDTAESEDGPLGA